ncbi:hypothetical protein ACFV2Q_04115 [Streptomyces sp. NPDC059650]|uniref:hypothetical protein n=1 Tax=Streptomyces sp. NPDC059650 TaxID=3346896 RepID=UPI0036B3DB49
MPGRPRHTGREVGVCCGSRVHLSFCDSSGLIALPDARNLAIEHHHGPTLAAPGKQVLRLLELTATLGLSSIEPTAPS